MRTSLFQLRSVGVVLETKKKDSWIAKLYPIEIIPLRDGDLTEIDTLSQTIETVTGQVLNATVDFGNFIEARWLPGDNTNRTTPPDVVVGETVLIYQYADTDEYFWVTHKFQTKLRMLEHVTHHFSNTPEPLTELTPDNTYWINISTRDKKIRLHTSINDGEFTTYDITIDTKEGELLITDGDDNKIHLESKEKRITLKTGTEVIVDTPDTYVKGNVWIDGTLDVKKDTSLHANLKVDGNTKIDGNLTAGPTSVKGNLSVSGSANISGVSKAARHV